MIQTLLSRRKARCVQCAETLRTFATPNTREVAFTETQNALEDDVLPRVGERQYTWVCWGDGTNPENAGGGGGLPQSHNSFGLAY